MKKAWYRGLGVVLIGFLLFGWGCQQPSEPYLDAVGIGVSNLELSVQFYTTVIGMKVKRYLKERDMEQVVLAFKDGRGSDVILMHYADEAEVNYADNPDKLVFYVPDAVETSQAIDAAGLPILSFPAAMPEAGGVLIGMAKDPDGYLIELVEDPTTSTPYLGAIGIGVDDMAASADFYTRVIGMTEQYRLSLDFMDEIIFEFDTGGGSAVVLMHYATAKNYRDLPVKLVYRVPDPKEYIEAIEREGMEINKSCKFKRSAKDPDGYLLEFF